ncbi:MAG: outer membrane beta-barrel protein [Bacteroidota bacterium]
MKSILCVFLFLLFFFFSKAQQLEATVVLNDGEVKTGIIKHSINISDFKGVVLNTPTDELFIELKHLQSIEAKDKLYLRRTIRYESLDIDILTESFVKGAVNLLEGKMPDKKTFYFINKRGEGESRIINASNINSFLNFYFQDCDSWKTLEDKAIYRYNKGQLIEIVELNKDCFQPTQIDYKKRKAALAFVGNIFFHNSTIDEATSFYPFGESQFNTVQSIGFGASGKLKFQKILEIQQDINFTRTFFSTDFANFSPFSRDDIYSEVALNFSNIESQTLLRFSIPVSSAFELSPALGFHAGFIAQKTVDEVNYGNQFYKNLPKDFDVHTFSPGLIGALGVAYFIQPNLQMSMEYRYVTYTSKVDVPANSLYSNLNKTRHQIGLYLFYHLNVDIPD